LTLSCGLYYKHVTMVNDASSSVNKLKASLNDAAKGAIYEHHMFIVQATGSFLSPKVAKAITVVSLEQDVLKKNFAYIHQGPFSQHYIFFVT
jgi:hypothetical protein